MSGWAKDKHTTPHNRPQAGRGMRGVFLTDMPLPRPVIRKRKIKGLAGLTDADPDYVPGEGTWTEVER